MEPSRSGNRTSMLGSPLFCAEMSILRFGIVGDPVLSKQAEPGDVVGSSIYVGGESPIQKIKNSLLVCIPCNIKHVCMSGVRDEP